jgi:hypothetical protein
MGLTEVFRPLFANRLVANRVGSRIADLEEDKGWRTAMARLVVISGVQARAGRRVALKVARGQPINSSGPLTFECGNCGAVVLQNVRLEQVRDCVVECGCGTFNEIP